MKKTIFIVVLSLTLAVGAIFTGYRLSAQKQEDVMTSMLNADRADDAVQKTEEAEEWISFRQESESKINDHEKRIAELKTEIKNNEEIFDDIYRKKIANLAEKIRFIKARLINYQESPGNWESFKYGINRDMDTMEKAFRELTVENKE